MGRARNLADVIGGNFDIPSTSLDNAQAALEAGDITADLIADGAVTPAKLSQSYQTPLTAGTDYLAPDGDGSGLSGLSSSSSKITVELESGTSLTAGGAVSLSPNGKVANYPTLNSVGNEIDNTADYRVECPDGATRVRTTISGSYNNTITIYGQYRNPSTYAITESTTTFSVTADSGVGNAWQGGSGIWAIGDNYYFGAISNTRDGGSYQYQRTDVHGFIFKVNPSTGVPTKIGEVSHYSDFGTAFAGSGFSAISKDHFYLVNQLHNGGTRRFKEIRFNRATETVSSYSFNATSFLPSGASNQWNQVFLTHRTSDNSTLLSVSGNTLRAQPLSNGGVDLVHTSPTTSSLRTDYKGDGKVNFHPSDPYMMYYYQDTSDIYKFVLYSISSNGTLTEEDVLETGTTSVWTGGPIQYGSSYKEFICKGSNGWITGLIDSSNNFVGLGVPNTYYGIESYIVKIDDTTFLVRGTGTSGAFYREYSVNAYQTDAFDYMGLSNDTTSSGSAEITVAGVKDGYTGLTVGATYYLSDTYDGTINTDSTKSTPKVGKAISSTEILMSEIL